MLVANARKEPGEGAGSFQKTCSGRLWLFWAETLSSTEGRTR